MRRETAGGWTRMNQWVETGGLRNTLARKEDGHKTQEIN